MSPLSTADRQAIYRAHMRRKGYIQTTIWIPKRYREEVKSYLKQLRLRYEGSHWL